MASFESCVSPISRLFGSDIKSVSFTGHRPSKLPWRYDDDDPRCAALASGIEDCVRYMAEAGVCEFSSGMALGVDTMAASAVLSVKKMGYPVRLRAVLPCEAQDEPWPVYAQRRYRSILESSDEVELVCREYVPDCMRIRDRRLVQLCDMLLCVAERNSSGGSNYTAKRAGLQLKPVVRMHPVSLSCELEGCFVQKLSLEL